jgi:alpha-mannosidase
MSRQTLYYTFGNHMHWVDMEWLWGYHVMPGSVRDMLAFCQATGAKGNVNFDGIGYEKLAIEAPDALADLRAAVQAGQLEPVGGSYGQPYGLFHGGEANIRQRVYGVRTITRLLGVRPKTFWEEEFDFFPQLPQMLCGTGFRYGSLFFQWTWHTPDVPEESAPAIWWEGQDGSRLLSACKNALNLHQWPEDFMALLSSDRLRAMETPGIVQWLELMPSQDWMCRSELMIAPLKTLLDHPDFEVHLVTLSEYLERAKAHAVSRRYTLDDVFHGLSLGKNGDLFRRQSRQAEQQLLTAEALSSLAGLLGRPYASWDVYPTWELEEGWRELLVAQHHDNDECEGLCGHIGLRSYERSLGLSKHVLQRTAHNIAVRIKGPTPRTVVFNPLGWRREVMVQTEDARQVRCSVPAFGYTALRKDEPTVAQSILEQTATTITLRRGDFSVIVDTKRGLITQMYSRQFPNGALSPDYPLADLWMQRNGQRESFNQVTVGPVVHNGQPVIEICRQGANGASIQLQLSIAPELDALDIHVQAQHLPRPDPGFSGALRTRLAIASDALDLIHDHPYGLSPVQAQGHYRRKYPTGDWMTSPQVFEEVPQPFTALQLLDLIGENGGMLVMHDGSQSLQRQGNQIEWLLTLYDPWDEAYFVSDLSVHMRLFPHGPLTHQQRWQLAQEFTRPVIQVLAEGQGDLPLDFSPLEVMGNGVSLTAWYRETAEASLLISEYAAREVAYPYVLRLVEFNGDSVPVTLRFQGELVWAAKTNLLGELDQALPIDTSGEQSLIHLTLRPYEIVTLYLDWIQGRKVSRDLDARRSVWAQVHRTGESR